MAEDSTEVERTGNPKEPLFKRLDADDAAEETTEIESLCMNCGKNGITRLLLTDIPHYKSVVLMSFSCEHCGYENNEIQSGGSICPMGIRITLHVRTQRDLNRQVVKSDHTSVSIPSLDFEVPSGSQKGEVTTVEGILERSIAGLEQDQARRKLECPEAFEKIEDFLERLRRLKKVEEPFEVILEDISGECHVENPRAPLKDEDCSLVRFKRTEEQNRRLGIYQENEDVLLRSKEADELEVMKGEVLRFPTNCPDCNSPCETNMKLTSIPHFKDVVIMATLCDACGRKTNEVKSTGGIEPLGVRIEVSVSSRDDFDRDLLKSDTCSIEIPELELEVGPAALSGRFTTVEGIIVAIKEQLSTSTAFMGDSSDPEAVRRMDRFLESLGEVLEARRKVTLILDDPTGNTYVQSLQEEGTDPGVRIEKYERTFEQNEELGLNDMKVEDY